METAEFYHVRNEREGRPGYEWAVIFIHEPTGTFSAVSSFGNFAYIWRARGSETLKQFLADLEYGYFFGKTSASRGNRFDPEESSKNIKRLILDRRREKSIDKVDARYAWRKAEELDGLDNEGAFFHDAHSSPSFDRVLTHDDFMDIGAHGRDPQCDGFWQEIWPQFLKQIAPGRTPAALPETQSSAAIPASA